MNVRGRCLFDGGELSFNPVTQLLSLAQRVACDTGALRVALDQLVRYQVRLVSRQKMQRQFSLRGGQAELVERKFGIKLGVTAVGALLAKLGLTPQKPLQRAYQRDPQAIET